MSFTPALEGLPTPRPARRITARYVLAQVALIVCLVASGMLAAEHLGGLRLPGCGPLSGCAQLAAGPWGSVLGWPVAFLGTAWFAAMLLFHFWTGRREGAARLFRWAVRLGALGSVFFISMMIAGRHFCPYCLAVHAGNLTFWLLVEWPRRLDVEPYFGPAVASTAVFAAVSLFLGLCQSTVKQNVADQFEREFQESLDRIVARVRAQNKGMSLEGTPEGDSPIFAAQKLGQSPAQGQSPGCLSERWRRGPEKAALRLVLFGDYQCPHCRAVETEIQTAMASRPDISLVVKHYPLCKDCNRQIQAAHLHDEACRLALAIEAAGLLGGNDLWWRMHGWLLSHGAELADADLRAALPSLGCADADAFFAAMRGPEALRRVQDDVQEAAALGIDSTPVLFINGVELAHPDLRGGIPRAIAAISRENPAPRTCAADRPRPGQERLLSLWLAGPQFPLSRHAARWTLGPPDAPHRVVLSICYQSEYSPRFSRVACEWATRRSDVRIEVWHFPLSRQHNLAYARTKGPDHADAYDMALVAEAAGQLGGNETFWKMHRWLLEHQAEFSMDAVRAAAGGLGLEADKLLAAAAGEKVRSAVQQDMESGAAAGFQSAPGIYLAGRLVPGPEPTPALLDRIVQEIQQRSIR